MDIRKLGADQVRWICDPQQLGFASTAELPEDQRFFGQEEAIEALRYGLETRSHGHNIFVRGISGIGRTALVHRMVEEYQPSCRPVPDRCYVHHFSAQGSVRLITLPTGDGKYFQDAMERFASFIENELQLYLASERIKSREKRLEELAQEEMRRLGRPLEEELGREGLALLPMQVGQSLIPAIVPVIDKKAVTFEELQKLRAEGQISDKDFDELIEKISTYEKKMAEIGQDVASLQLRHREAVASLKREEVKMTINARLEPVLKKWTGDDVRAFIGEVTEDVLERQLASIGTHRLSARNYRVNLVLGREAGARCPIISEKNPTLSNLVGTIEREFSGGGLVVHSDHLMVKPGSLLQADGGFLVIEAQEILTEPGAWSALLRTLKTGQYELVSPDFFGMTTGPQLKLEPVPIDVKVILIGDPRVFDILDAYEPRFSGLFKILVDFSDTLERDAEGMNAYSLVISRVVKSEELLNFDAEAVARIIEHGARICSERTRLTSRFTRIADICREASYMAEKNHHTRVTASDVRQAIMRSRKRADLPVRRFHRMIADQLLKLDLKGEVVGQINGLAVTQAGPLTFGFPTRITASIGPGSSGVINIERESELSGAVHTKAFLILSGLMRHLVRVDHPLAFSASLAFEQTYGGIDGDSASGAEFCCLISALTDAPIRQGIAMTGAVDQKGNILPVGAVTEKIEGFYDSCKALGVEGGAGVIIPASNSEELMLREDLVEAVRRDEFSVYAISSIKEALTLLMGKDAGDRGKEGYPSGTLLNMAEARANRYWQSARDGSRSRK